MPEPAFGPTGQGFGGLLPSRPPSLSSIAGALAPTVAFLLAHAAWGVVAGIVVSTAAAVASVLWRQHRGGGVGWLSLALLAYVVARGTAGALTGSHQVFFGIGVLATTVVAAAVLASAFTATPAAGYLVPALMGRWLLPATVRHPVYRRVCAHVTAVWATAELAVTGWEAWHLQHAAAVEFIGARAMIGWPAMAGVVFACAFYARFRIEWHQGPRRGIDDADGAPPRVWA